MADIFISHIHEEAEAAKALNNYLKGYGLKGFLSSDNWQIHAGERWFERITQELEQAKIVILMLSRQSVARPWINFEAGWAWSKGKVTIPACFGGLTPGDMPRPYSDLQGLSLGQDSYALARDCCHHLKQQIPPPSGLAEQQEFLEALGRFD